ncbi:MAG TPA: flavin reductase family protein [Actinomycetota bacterium]|nr:flavin reductase family protein [Actinomycetota bacterium]
MTDRVDPTVDPFATPPEAKTPLRRFRGRLATGVTIWTSGHADSRAGLTVSSVIVGDGEPPVIGGLVGDLTSLWDALTATGRFVVHVLDGSQSVLADVFAGLRPSPGGVFAGLEVEDSAYGPVLPFLGTRVRCRLLETRSAGYQPLVLGAVEAVEVGDLDTPLIHFRGRYRRLDQRG